MTFSLVSSPYQMINALAGIVILLVFSYSAIFSPGNSDYPVDCAHIATYGESCPTCGLSHSFSEMIRGNYSSAIEYNRNGPLLFIFFSGQMVLRTLAGFILFLRERRISVLSLDNKLLYKYKKSINKLGQALTGQAWIALIQRYEGKEIRLIAFTDAAVSVILFLICFRYLLVFW